MGWVDAFREALELRYLRPETQARYIACLRAFERALSTPLPARSRKAVRAWLLHLVRERRLAPSTYAVHLAALRFFFTYVVGRPAALEDVPRPIIRPPVQPRPLTRGELIALFDAAPHRTARLLLHAAYATGLRIGELCRLHHADVVCEERMLVVRDAKGGLGRMVMSGDRLLEEFGLLQGSNVRVFPVAPRTARRWFHQSCSCAGLRPGLRFHDLRHTFATHLLEAGIDPRTVQAALGHRTMRATVRYLHALPARVVRTPSPLDLLLGA